MKDEAVSLSQFFISVFAALITCSTTINTKNYVFSNKVTIKQIVDIAYKNRQDLHAFDHLIKANRYGEKAAIGGYLPQILITIRSGKASKPIAEEIEPLEVDIPGALQDFVPVEIPPLVVDLPEAAGAYYFARDSITLDISQLIFSLDGPMMQRKIAQQDTYISKAQKHQLENQIRFNTESAYLELKKLKLKDLLVKRLDISSQITFDKDTWRENVGFLNIPQWEQAKADFSLRQSTVSNYPNDIEQALSVLERETNFPINPDDVPTSLQDLENIKLHPLAYYQKKGLENRPDLEEQYYRIKQTSYYERNYKYTYVPEISFFTNVTKNKYTACGKKPLYWNLGLKVDWFLDGFTNANLSSKFDQHQTEFILRKRDLELKIVKDVKQIYFFLKNLLSNLEPREAQYIQSLTQLGNLKQQYEIGLAPLFEYEQAKLRARNDGFALTSLKIDIRTNYQKLLFLCGYPPCRR